MGKCGCVLKCVLLTGGLQVNESIKEAFKNINEETVHADTHWEIINQ